MQIAAGAKTKIKHRQRIPEQKPMKQESAGEKTILLPSLLRLPEITKQRTMKKKRHPESVKKNVWTLRIITREKQNHVFSSKTL